MDFFAKKPYTVLGEEDILSRMDKEIESLSGTLLLPKSVATVLLARNGWNLYRVYDSWVLDDDECLLKSGLKIVSKLSHDDDSFEYETKCGICFESCESCEIVSTPFCVHLFCRKCWGRYFRNYIDNNFGDCSKMSCPAQDCRAAVGPDTINLLTETDRLKYRGSLVRSYVNRKNEIKWCPAAGCENAVELQDSDDEDQCLDVICRCSHMFCWNCLLESHRPVTCNNASDWIRTGTDESLSLNWILANTKQCPNCFRPIERDHAAPGCNMMTCSAPCKFQFCWKCLKPQMNHKYTELCSVNEANLPDKMTVEAYERLDSVASSFQKVSYCSNQWEVNSQAIEQAVSNLNHFENLQMEQICRKYDVNKKDLGFLRETFVLIVQCRQVLKWSYVYDFYLSEYENAKKEYLKHLQESAVSALKMFCEKLEMEMEKMINGENERLFLFNKNVKKLRETTWNYFNQFVKTLEEGLMVSVSSYEDVGGAHWFCDVCTFQNSWLDKECQACCQDLIFEGIR